MVQYAREYKKRYVCNTNSKYNNFFFCFYFMTLSVVIDVRVFQSPLIHVNTIFILLNGWWWYLLWRFLPFDRYQLLTVGSGEESPIECYFLILQLPTLFFPIFMIQFYGTIIYTFFSLYFEHHHLLESSKKKKKKKKRRKSLYFIVLLLLRFYKLAVFEN